MTHHVYLSSYWHFSNAGFDVHFLSEASAVQKEIYEIYSVALCQIWRQWSMVIDQLFHLQSGLPWISHRSEEPTVCGYWTLISGWMRIQSGASDDIVVVYISRF